MPTKIESEIEILKHMQSDISLVKQKVLSMEREIGEISQDLHGEVRPEYLKKLQAIKKQKGIRFKNMKEFDKHFSR